MKKRSIFSAAACALLFTAVNTGTANAAASGFVHCSTTGVWGTINYNNWNTRYSTIGVDLTVHDAAADGHHVKIRLITIDDNRDWHYNGWHSLYDGNGSTYTWYSAIQDDRGVYSLGVEAATFEGSSKLYHCTDFD